MIENSKITIDTTNILPDYMTWLINNRNTLAIVTLTLPFIVWLAALLFIVYIALYLIRLKKVVTDEFVYLEVKPTDKTLKSPLSTDQLLTVLHSIVRKQSLWEKLIHFKRNISFELVSTKQSGIRYIFRVPKNNISVIKKTLLAYLPGIETKVAEDYLSLPNSTIRTKELRLGNSFVYPLQDQSILSQHDPIAYITAQMTKLHEEELVALQFISSPVQESTHSHIVHQVKEIKHLLLSNADIANNIQPVLHLNALVLQVFQTIAKLILFIVLLPFTFVAWLMDKQDQSSFLPWWVLDVKKNRKLNEVGLPKQQLYQSIENKINQPLFETTIRFISFSDSKLSGERRLTGLVSSFDTFSTANQLLVASNKRSFINSIFNFEIRNRLSLIKHSSILSVSELSSLYHLPYTVTTQTEDIQKIKSPQLPPPLSLKKLDTKFDITFAKNMYGDTQTIIGQTLEERRRHTYIIGATGTGKTTLLLQMIHSDLQSGKGLAVIDPHGDLSKRLLEIIPKNRIKDVIYFNPYDIEYPIGLNFLELPQNLSAVEREREKDFITSSLISVFHKLYDARYSGPRMEHILRNVVLTALELENPTLFTIYQLLTNTKYRKQVLSTLRDEVLVTFWKKEFAAQGSYQRAEQISPITNKLGRFLTTTITRNILNQPKSKLDFNEIMDNNKILLCDLSKGKIGEDNSFFLGSLIIAKLELAAFRRINTPERDRKDYYLYVDEFQNFANTAFAQVLSEARKYRLCAILAHQNTVQIENDLLDTIIGNTGTIIAFRTSSPKDENKIQPIFAPKVEEGQIANLPSYHFYIKINALQPQDAFTGEIDDFTVQGNSDIRSQVILNSQSCYSTKMLSKENGILKEKITPKKRKPIANNENLFEQIKTE